MRICFAMIAVLAFADVSSADVSVTGSAKIPYIPDQANFHVNVVGEGDHVAAAIEKRDAVTKSLRDALAAAGLPASEIKMTPTLGQRFGSYGSVSGVKATNHISISVDLKKMAPILDVLATSRPGVEVSLELSNSQITKITDQARVAAIEDAKRKADLYARAAGATIGSVVSITEVAVANAEQPPERYSRSTNAETPRQMIAVELKVSFSLKSGGN